jgi:hypothetical protein
MLTGLFAAEACLPSVPCYASTQRRYVNRIPVATSHV